jgi:Holliday junction resolvase RusA-like endonuclease
MSGTPHLTVTVTDHRPAPQGSKKHIGNGRMVEQSKRVEPWRKAVAVAARQAIGAGWTPLDGPLAIEVIFTVRKPKSAPKTRTTWPCTRDSGDLDKLLRSTFDALATDVSAIADDSRVIQVTAVKAFPGEHPDTLPQPGAVIRIWALNLPQQRSAA